MRIYLIDTESSPCPGRIRWCAVKTDKITIDEWLRELQKTNVGLSTQPPEGYIDINELQKILKMGSTSAASNKAKRLISKGFLDTVMVGWRRFYKIKLPLGDK
jgi:hypothetical protein